MSSFPCAIPGINLNSWTSPQKRGWGSPCNVQLATVVLSQVRIGVHVALAELAGLIMKANEAQGYIYRAGVTGCYNCRKNANNPALSSWHSWAHAIDCNWDKNPNRWPIVTDRPRWEIERWNRYGWGWGGDYDPSNPPDTMHVEFHGTPAQAQAALELARRELGALAGQSPGAQPVPSLPTGTTDKWHAIPIGGVTDLWAQGEQVRRDQQDLIDSGFTVGASGADDFAGPDTIAAIKVAQGALKVKVDGEMGEQTRTALHRIPSYGLPVGHVWGDIHGPADMHGGINAFEQAKVKALQGQLIRKVGVNGNRDPNRTNWDDGKFESATTSVVRLFQANEGLAQDGVVGPITWTRLFL